MTREKVPARSTLLRSLMLMLCSFSLFADDTKLSNVPLTSSTSDIVKPNLLLVLDTSGSMDTQALPDQWGVEIGAYVGMRNHLCNPIYYKIGRAHV